MSFVVMPKTDWQNILNSVRAKTGKSGLLVSSEVSAEVDSISGSIPAATAYSQMNPIVTRYMDEITYDPADYGTSNVLTYSYTETDYTKFHPVGYEVTINVAGEITLADKRTSFARESFAGTNEVVNAVPGSVTSWWNVANGSITTSGYIKPTGQVRMIKTAASNVRDLGGWPCDGGTIHYGKLFRGGALSADDAPVLVEQCGVRHDLDLRGEEAEGITESPMGSVVHYTCPGYPWYTLNSASWKSILQTIFDAVSHNEPLIFHCAAGADRTGTVACIVESLLGVAQPNLDKDFELTTFAVHPNARRRTDENWKNLIGEISAYMGDTFRDKVANWVCSIGFTANEINAFRQTMIDGTPEVINPVAAFIVTNNLTNVTTSNSVTSVQSGNGYVTTITAVDGYELSSLIVTMGGVDVTADVVTSGKIQIDSVTGNVVITATAKEISTAPALKNFADQTSEEWVTNSRLGSSSVSSETNGSIVTNCIPCAKGDIITIEGLNISWLESEASARFWYLDSNKNIIGSPFVYVSGDGFSGKFTYTSHYTTAYNWTYEVGSTADGGYVESADQIAYVRFCGSLETTSENVVINVNGILDDGSTVETFTVTNNLTNATSSNSTTSVQSGGAYVTTITPDDGYKLSSVTVTMGGIDVTNDVVTSGKIQIDSTAGDIVVTAVAVKSTSSYTNLADPTSTDWLTNKRLGSSGVSDETNGSIVTNYIPCKTGDVVRISGLNIGWLKSASNARCHFLASDKSILGTSIILADDLFAFTDNTNQIYAYEWIGTIGNGDSASYPTIAYIRFCGSLKTTAADVIITVNEEILA